jgi:broad specificity phosphatase PhoE
MGCANAQPKIYIVRHAEKLADWPGGEAGAFQPLSEEGIATANRLAGYFDPGSITAIYSSATTRTLHTAFPLGQKLGLQIKIAGACADTSAIEAFYQELSKNYSPNDTILLVSHSNIVPYLLIKAGLPKDCHEKMDFTDWNGWLLTDYYGDLFFIENGAKDGNRCDKFKRISF